MDYEDIIKLQEESPVYSTGNNSHTLKQCMASFYDNDSDFDRKEEPQEVHPHTEHVSFQQAIDYVQNFVDIIDTPIDDILNCFERLQCGQDLDKMILRKKILRRKNLLKRYRAKNRQPKVFYSIDLFSEMVVTNSLETEAQIKKKRNRVSAQISRDRKKQYFKELQLKNLKLEEEIIRARLENEKLKRQMQDTEPRAKARIFSEAFNNKLTKLLIFLGIIFLIGILKETFASTSQSLLKFKTAQKTDQISQFSSVSHDQIIGESQQKVSEFLEDAQVENQLALTEDRKLFTGCQVTMLERNRPKGKIYERLIQKLQDMKVAIQKKGF